MIIRAVLLPKKEKIQYEMSLLLEWVSLSSRVLMDILEFHAKSRSHFDLLSFAYLIVQKFNLLELQMNNLKCPNDI